MKKKSLKGNSRKFIRNRVSRKNWTQLKRKPKASVGMLIEDCDSDDL